MIVVNSMLCNCGGVISAVSRGQRSLVFIYLPLKNKCLRKVAAARINIIGSFKKAQLPPSDLGGLGIALALALALALAPSDLSKQEYKSLMELKKDNTIQVIPADKGRSTVILDVRVPNDRLPPESASMGKTSEGL